MADESIVEALHLHSPHPLVDDLRPGDEIAYDKRRVLVRFVANRHKQYPGFTEHALISWRTKSWLDWEFRRRGDLLDKARRINRRDAPLRESDPEKRLQDLIDVSGDSLSSFRSFGKRGYVYFFAGERLCKIGFAVDVDARLRNLQFYCETKLVMLGCMLGDRALETELHARFAHLRQHGEWFELTDELRAFIQEAA